jgi:transposase
MNKCDAFDRSKLCYRYDKLQSKWPQPEINHRKKYRCKRAGARMQRRIRNLVDDLHKKVTKWTCENYNTISLRDPEDGF